MGIGGSSSAANLVYVLGVHLAVPGHREQLDAALKAPGSTKIQTGSLVLQHLEGGNWTFMGITRYNSWQDFATDRAEAGTATPTAAGGWGDIASIPRSIATRLPIGFSRRNSHNGGTKRRSGRASRSPPLFSAT